MDTRKKLAEIQEDAMSLNITSSSSAQERKNTPVYHGVLM